MTRALGGYTLSRQASDNAWQPDSWPHGAVPLGSVGRTPMGHAVLHGVCGRSAPAPRSFAIGDVSTSGRALSTRPRPGSFGTG